MLKLTTKACDSGASVPKYIVLNQYNIIGRAYRSDIWLRLPWLSRKHLTVTHVDENYIVDCCGKAGVFLNGRKISINTLAEGDRLTIGGFGKKRNKITGPYIEYQFTNTREVEDPENIYKKVSVDEDDLIAVSEETDGVIVEEQFHSEDFNCTQLWLDSDSEHNSTPSTPRNSQGIPKTPKSEVVKSEVMPRAARISTAPRTKTPKSEVHVDTVPQVVPVPAKRATRVRPKRSKENDEPGATTGATPASVKKDLACSTALSVQKDNIAGGLLGGATNVQGTSAIDPWEQFRQTQQLLKGMSKQIDQMKEKQTKPTAVSDSANTKSTPTSKDIEQTLDDSSNDGTTKRRSRRSVKRPVRYKDSDKSHTEASDDETKGPSKAKRSRGADKNFDSATVEFSNDETLPEIKEVAGKAKRSRGRDKASDPASVMASDVETLPEIKKVAIKKPTVDHYIELPDVEEINDEWKPSTGRAGATLTLQKSSGKLSAKGGKGKGKAAKDSKPLTREEEELYDLWHRPPAKTVKPHFVEVLRGRFKGILFNYTDKDIFRVRHIDGSNPEPLFNSNEYNSVLEVDSAHLKQKIIHGHLNADDLNGVFRLVRKTLPQCSMTDYDKCCILPNDTTISQPAEVNSITLHQYQLNTLSWMKKVEDRVDKEWTVSKLAEWEESEMGLLFDIHEKVAYLPPIPRDKNTVLGIKARGGILADQMGLGKTVVLLSLFLLNKPPGSRIPDPHSYQQQNKSYLDTKATLVVAPSHLTAQWKEEAQKYAPSMKVIVITTKTQYDKVSYGDLLLADVVIVSVQFLLNNKAFTNKPTGVQGRSAFLQLMLKPGVNPLKECAPNLCHFRWLRIVADEAHELLTYEQVKSRAGGVQASAGLETLSKLDSQFRWYVSGTPFPHGARSLRGALKFIQMEVDDPALTYPDGSLKVDTSVSAVNEDFSDNHLYLNPLHHIVKTNFYVRNTKDSIGEEYNVPEYIEELILLSMSPVERGVYDRTPSDIERRKLCCHLQIAHRIQNLAGVQQKSLEEVRKALVDHNKMEIQNCEDKIKRFEEELPKVRDQMNSEPNPAAKRLHQARITRLLEDIKGVKEELERCNNAFNYFTSIVPRIQHSADEPCVICLDNITELTVTTCGHLFCQNCILPCIRTQGMCPTCRQAIREESLIVVKDADIRQELAKSEELKKLTEQYGTKMAYLIFYLRNLFNHEGSQARVIIFSQWDALLHKIGETLQENNIANVFVKGNVHVRNKAIMSFRKQLNTRVIMLSLQHAASGTNLVEATHVILIDPVAGSKEEAIAIESQAIGRAHRMGQDKQISVVRMIMKDTIEHELYMRNRPDDVQQLEFNFESTNRFGGPQIMRTQCHISEPDPAILRTALQTFDHHDDYTMPQIAVPRNRRNRGIRTTGRQRRGGFGFNVFRRRWIDVPSPREYDDDRSNDSSSDSGGRNDCVLS